jgi:hypothetical protein
VHQDTGRIDDEGAAVGRPVLEQHVEGTAQLVCRVGDDGIVDIGETRIRFEPGLVAEVTVGARPENHSSLAEELVVEFSERRELGGTDEREIARVEEQNDPAAVVI